MRCGLAMVLKVRLRIFYSPYDDIASAGDHKENMIRVSGVNWFTNLEIPKRNEELDLVCRYSEDEYPKYDNYDAINVGRTQDIPCDYAGLMGGSYNILGQI